MKITKQPQHCAHVADYYADQTDMLTTGHAAQYLRPWFTDIGHIQIGGAFALVAATALALKNAKLAAREWLRAGGAA